MSSADLFRLLATKANYKKKNKQKVPDWCPRATYESARWSDFWFERKFLFYAFKYRWSHIRKTLQNRNEHAVAYIYDHLGSYDWHEIINRSYQKESRCRQAELLLTSQSKQVLGSSSPGCLHSPDTSTQMTHSHGHAQLINSDLWNGHCSLCTTVKAITCPGFVMPLWIRTLTFQKESNVCWPVYLYKCQQ